MSKEKDVLSALLGAGTVSFHAVFAKALGSVTAALFLSQAYFWQQKARFSKTKTVEEKPFFERTAEAWYEDTGLTTDQQVAARQRLKRLGILEEKKMGLPAKLYYHVCLDTLVSVIYRYNETGKSVVEDYRTKKRYITRTVDGKFWKQQTVKNGNNIESLESLENLRERDAPAEIQNPSTLKEGKKRSPLVAPPPYFPPGPESPEQITPWNEDLLAAEFLKHIAGETPETAAKHAKEICQKIDMHMPPTDRAPLRYDQYPRPTNAKELREAMSAYFKDNPHEWSDGVLEEGRAKNWNVEKIKNCVQEFCLYQEKTDNLKQKYSQYKAALTLWFRREERFDAPVQAKGYVPKKEPSVIPSNIQRFK